MQNNSELGLSQKEEKGTEQGETKLRKVSLRSYTTTENTSSPFKFDTIGGIFDTIIFTLHCWLLFESKELQRVAMLIRPPLHRMRYFYGLNIITSYPRTQTRN
jgi:hypothetical protein